MKRIASEFRLYLCNYWVNAIPSHRFRLWFYKKIMKFKIGDGSSIFMRCTFDCASNFSLGKNSVINSNCRIDPRGGLHIGSSVSISNDTIILTAYHNMDDNMKGGVRFTKIEDYVWVGTRAMILPGLHVRKGSVIAAGAVVTNNVDENSVVGGVPARVIKKRINPQFDYNASYRRLFQ